MLMYRHDNLLNLCCVLIRLKIVLEKDDRLRLVEICCRMKLGRSVTLLERMWRYKLIHTDDHAAGIAERFK